MQRRDDTLGGKGDGSRQRWRKEYPVDRGIGSWWMPGKRRGGSASDGYWENSCGRRERIPCGHKGRWHPEQREERASTSNRVGYHRFSSYATRPSPVGVLAGVLRVYGASAGKKARARRQEGTSSWRGSALPARPWPRQVLLKPNKYKVSRSTGSTVPPA